jgi:capsular polysaccharide biosynthesis protein
VWFFVLAFLSAGISLGLAFIINFFDPAIQDESYLEEEFGLPVLATIQHYDTQQPAYFISKT